MRPEPVTFKLGEKDFRVRPLTIAQHQEIGRMLMQNDPADPLATNIAIVAAALRRDYPDVAADIGQIECSLTELGVASGAVLEFCGITRKAESGEA